jgi:aspartate/methionine/tyrosine aminotransferase
MPSDSPLVRRAASRAVQMPPFLVMEVLERAQALERTGRSVIHLEVGEPDFNSPPAVIAAGQRALDEGRTHYTHSLGRLELRQAIAARLRREHGVDVSPERIVVAMGSSAAMLLVFAALLEPGDEVLLTDPCYACYPNFITAFGGAPVRTPVCEADGFQYDPDAVRRAFGPRTRALVLNSPANPTGTLTSPARMAALADLCRDRALIISDEIYHGLTYGEAARSMLEFDPDAVVISGFSKRFAMTGWRLGYAVLPEWLVRPVQKLQQNLFISAADFPQLAALAALEQSDAEIEAMRREYDVRRRLVLRRLDEMGLRVLTEPRGAFYVFVNVSQLTDDVHRFAFDVLEHAGVALTPGADFGPGGAGYVRISYANSQANIEEGLRRLRTHLRR